MPALITHFRFGTEVYEDAIDVIGGTRDEACCFLLGNQGPDPLFFALADPRIAPAFMLGRKLHRLSPSVIVRAFVTAAKELTPDDQQLARAYILGFFCHYLADSTIHPFVYAQQYALCDAGEPGLDRDDGTEVHALIETELDELVLTTRMGTTIADFHPADEILEATPRALLVIDELYARAMPLLQDPNVACEVPSNLFSAALGAYRRIQSLMYSRDGVKRAVLGRLEQLVRHYSHLQAMSHRNIERTESAFDNREHAPWIDPATGERRTESFIELYDRARETAREAIALAEVQGMDAFAERIADLTDGRNFVGDIVEATILDVEDGDEPSPTAPPSPVLADAPAAPSAASPAASASPSSPPT